jgi:hypothetical protein
VSVLEQMLAEQEAPAVWPAPLGAHLSASQLTMLQRCPEQWRRRYLCGEVERPGAAMVWGAADHYAHEQNFRQKIDSRVDLPVDDVKDAFADGLDRAIERNGGLSEIAWGDDDPADVKDKGVLLVEAYHRQVSPTVQPVQVEQRFEARILGVPVPIVGYIDLETATAGIERKTAKAKVSTIKPGWRIQGLLYQSVIRKPVDWHVSTKTKTPGVWTPELAPGLRLEPNPAMVNATGRLVRNLATMLLAFYDTFGPDDPWPGAITHDWACQYCGYRKNCDWWAGQ